jgi:hypothetical protein
MKAIVFGFQAQKTLSAFGLDCRVMDSFEQFVTALEYISRTSSKHFEILALQIEALQIVFDLEIDSTKILVSQVRVIGDGC